MAIHRGIQSAIFFYLSCAPCADARYRKKRKREAAWDRAAREELAAELPNAYRHPSPSSTNPHWQAEIVLGPTGVVKGKKKTNGTSSDPRRIVQKTLTGLDSVTSGSRRIVQKTLTGLDSVTSGSRSELDIEQDGEGWNLRLYQREDEELWGSVNNLNGMLHDSSGLQIPARVRTKDSALSTYQATRNPPISDLHPATVTKVSSREEVMWMMQPPPVAEVMNGKERASRSRSDSGGSRLSPAMSASTLSRQVSAQMIERRTRAGETFGTAMSRESSSRTTNTPYTNPHGQNITTQQLSFTTISERDFALSPAPSRRDRDPSEDSYQTVLHHDPRRPQLHRIASRPQLSTITSAESLPSTALSLHRAPTPPDLPDLVNENSIPSPPQSRDSELAATTSRPRKRRPDEQPPIAHRHSTSILIHTGKELQLLRAEASPIGEAEAGADSRQRDDEGEEGEEEAILMTMALNGKGNGEGDGTSKTTAAELFDSWYTPDFELGTWVLEHTKREGVRERWSMDF